MIKNKRKFIDITTNIIYLFIIITYELFYCNLSFINGITKTYIFSFYRFVVYILIYVIYFIFKKSFIELAEKSFESSKKSKISYVLLFLTNTYLLITIGIVLLSKIITIKETLIIIGLLMFNLFIIYFSNDLIKNCIIICLTFGILFSISITVNNQLDEKRHFLSVYSLSLGSINTVNHTVDKSIADIR